MLFKMTSLARTWCRQWRGLPLLSLYKYQTYSMNNESNTRVDGGSHPKVEKKKKKKSSRKSKSSSSPDINTNKESKSMSREERIMRKLQEAEGGSATRKTVQVSSVSGASGGSKETRNKPSTNSNNGMLKEPSPLQHAKPSYQQDIKEERYKRKMVAMMETTKSKSETKEERYARKMAAMSQTSSSNTSGKSFETKEERYARKMAAMNDSNSKPKSSETREERYARKMAAMNTPSSSSSSQKEERLARKMATMNETNNSKTTSSMTEPSSIPNKSSSHQEKEERLARKLAAMNEQSSSQTISKEDRLARKMAAMNTQANQKRRDDADSNQISGLSQGSLEARKRIRHKEARRAAKELEASGRGTTTTTAVATLPPVNELASLSEPERLNVANSEGDATSNTNNQDAAPPRQMGAETRLDSVSHMSKTQRPTTQDDRTGAYHVSSRAIGALPAWARINNTNNQVESDSDDDVPPEMRQLNSDLPPELRPVPELQEQDSNSLVGDDGMITTAEVRVGGSSPNNNEGWTLKSFRTSPKLWIIIGISVLLLAGIATGVGIAFSSSSSSSSSNGDSNGIGSKPDSEFNPCDFSDTEQPDVFSQCACNGEITIFAKDSFQRYLDFTNTIALEINPDFACTWFLVVWRWKLGSCLARDWRIHVR